MGFGAIGYTLYHDASAVQPGEEAPGELRRMRFKVVKIKMKSDLELATAESQRVVGTREFVGPRL